MSTVPRRVMKKHAILLGYITAIVTVVFVMQVWDLH